MEVIQKDRKPYNPYTLAGGYAAKTLPDKKTIAVFTRYCAHADWLGTTTIGIETLMEETGYCHGAVCAAVETLKALNRISKKQRYHPTKGRGRETAVTKVHCSEAELRQAGATEENYFGKGGKATALPVVSSPKRPRVKSNLRTSKVQRVDGLKSNLGTSKVQLVAREPFVSPFLPLPFVKPLEDKGNGKTKSERKTSSSLRSTEPKQGKKENRLQHQEAAGNTCLPADKPRVEVPPPDPQAPVESAAAATPVTSQNPSPLKSEVAASLRAAGCPDSVFAALNGYTKIVTILNGQSDGGCTNPVTAYATFAGNNPKFAALWMPKPTGKSTGTDADWESDISPADVEALRRMAVNRTDAEKAEFAKLVAEQDAREKEDNKAFVWWEKLPATEKGPYPGTATIIGRYKKHLEEQGAAA